MKKTYLVIIAILILVLAVFWRTLLFYLILEPQIQSRITNEFNNIPIFSKDGGCEYQRYEYNSWTQSFSIRCTFYTTSDVISETRIKYKDYLQRKGWEYDSPFYLLTEPDFLTISYKKGLFRLIFQEVQASSGRDPTIDWGIILMMYYDVSKYVGYHNKLPPINFSYGTEYEQQLEKNLRRMGWPQEIDDCENNYFSNQTDRKEECVIRLAIGKYNESYCLKVDNTTKRFECYRRVAFQKGDLSLCEKTGPMKDDCYDLIAVLRIKNTSGCNLITNNSKKEDCIFSISVRSGKTYVSATKK